MCWRSERVRATVAIVIESAGTLRHRDQLRQGPTSGMAQRRRGHERDLIVRETPYNQLMEVTDLEASHRSGGELGLAGLGKCLIAGACSVRPRITRRPGDAHGHQVPRRSGAGYSEVPGGGAI